MRHLRKILSTSLVTLILATGVGFAQDTPQKLMPSGDVVFVNLKMQYPMVQRILDKKTELEVDDIILEVNSMTKKHRYNLEDLSELYKKQDEEVLVTYKRENKIHQEVLTSNDFRAVYLTSTQQFFGTITAIKKDGQFIAFSHNIEGGEVSSASDVYDTSYVHSEKATLFKSGGLAPHIKLDKLGEIETYGEYGVKGKLDKNTFDEKKAIEIAKPKKGVAYIYCKSPITNEMKMHEIEITKVYKDVSKIKVKDEELKKYRGGVIGGMSGSPVIQDGKIIGGIRSSIIFNHKIGFIANIDSMLSSEGEK